MGKSGLKMVGRGQDELREIILSTPINFSHFIPYPAYERSSTISEQHQSFFYEKEIWGMGDTETRWVRGNRANDIWSRVVNKNVQCWYKSPSIFLPIPIHFSHFLSLEKLHK